MSIIKKIVPKAVKNKIKSLISSSVDDNTLNSIIESVATRKAAAMIDTNKNKLHGKVAVVTGAYGFIGSCICRRLSQDGAKVIACGRNE